MSKPLTIPELKEKALWLRRIVLETIARVGKGHIGSTYSCADLLIALYYGGILRVNPKNPSWVDRDRFLIGKGHVCLALFSIFMDLGFISKAQFEEYGKDGGLLGGQLDIRTPGSEYNTGSLGHVLGIGAGIALAAKMDKKDYKAYVLLGDAECYEGAIWEAILFAGQRQLKNLVTIIDRNRLSVLEVLDDEEVFGNFVEKIKAFGWDSYAVDGHSFPEILDVFEKIRILKKPVMIIANTIKGKGISFMENGIRWHHSIPNAEELARARKELEII